MRKPSILASNVLAVSCLTIAFLFLAQTQLRTSARETEIAAEPAPVAVLKTILINGQTRLEAGSSEVAIVRQRNNQVVITGMPLLPGDEISTGAGVKLTILFLDENAETNNEVSLDENTRVQVGSLFTWLGKVVVTVKGAFETRTTRVRWSVRGTEYELVVGPDGTNTLRVLKGEVGGETGNFTPTVSQSITDDTAFRAVGINFAEELETVRPETRLAQPQTAQRVVANKLDQVVLPPAGPFAKSAAPQSQLDRTIRWTNQILGAGQPTYAPQSVVPHVQTWSERDRLFPQARRNSILFGDEKSNRMLAEIYLDWGKGAKAREELQRAASGPPQTAEELTRVGEASRLMGRLDEAEAALRRALAVNGNYPRAYNELGNVYLDRARIADGTNASGTAKKHLQTARENFSRASQLAVIIRDAGLQTARRNLNHYRATQASVNANMAQLVAKSNVGEADLELAKILQREGRAAEAMRRYEIAEQSFKESERDIGSYPFPTRGLGDVYRGIHNVATVLGDRAKAAEASRRSEQKYSEAIAAHTDFAEAYVGLGNLFMDDGRPREALRSYLQATRVRPDKPEAFYRVAIVLANDGETRSASRYASVYLKLQPTEFQRGFKADNARRVIKEQAPLPETPTSSATAMPTPTVSPTSTQSPTPPSTPTPSGTPIRIPGLAGDKPESALKELRDRGFVPKLADFPDCKGTNRVVFSKPAKDERVPPGTEVIVYVSSFGDAPITVPRFKGNLLSTAEEMASPLDLTLRVERTEETDRFVPDTVTWQDPDPDKKYKRGCEVKVRTAVPVPKTEVPPLVGKSIGEAEQLLSNANLMHITFEEDSEESPGTVISQDRAAGDIVPVRTIIGVHISSLGVEVPRVIGLTYTEAEKRLTDRGLKVAGDPVGDWEGGKVEKQDPPPGRRVPKGTFVTLTFPVGESLRE